MASVLGSGAYCWCSGTSVADVLVLSVDSLGQDVVVDKNGYPATRDIRRTKVSHRLSHLGRCRLFVPSAHVHVHGIGDHGFPLCIAFGMRSFIGMVDWPRGMLQGPQTSCGKWERCSSPSLRWCTATSKIWNMGDSDTGPAVAEEPITKLCFGLRFQTVADFRNSKIEGSTCGSTAPSYEVSSATVVGICGNFRTLLPSSRSRRCWFLPLGWDSP